MEGDDASAWGMGSADELPATVEEGEEMMESMVINDATPGSSFTAPTASFASSPNKRKRPAKLAIATESFRSSHRAQLSLERHEGNSPRPINDPFFALNLTFYTIQIPFFLSIFLHNLTHLPRSVGLLQRWRCWKSSQQDGRAAGARTMVGLDWCLAASCPSSVTTATTLLLRSLLPLLLLHPRQHSPSLSPTPSLRRSTPASIHFVHPLLLLLPLLRSLRSFLPPSCTRA